MFLTIKKKKILVGASVTGVMTPRSLVPTSRPSAAPDAAASGNKHGLGSSFLFNKNLIELTALFCLFP